MSKQVLNVGQCGFDHASITEFLRSHFDVAVTPAADEPEALSALEQRSFDLILVNRKFDCNGADGVEFIQKLDGNAPPVMLVSNFPEAQDAAVAAGARPGFGKSDYGNTEAVQRISDVLQNGDA
ncbi:response regulator transcription factor [Thalassoroseus pseudoceratinae]|uniref:response regulator transcription factor n=1 Tax=Thalassoroseus pseudoceratinae TaxID=2713176 RepID=UPI00141EF1C5|nr:response regulator transcription factor [Thalassoroseus pseudoceratinae]